MDAPPNRLPLITVETISVDMMNGTCEMPIGAF